MANLFCGVENFLTCICEKCEGKGYYQGEFAKTASAYCDRDKIDWDAIPTYVFIAPCDCEYKPRK